MRKSHSKSWFALAAFYAVSFLFCLVAGDDWAAASIGFNAGMVLADDDERDE
jgi:uncharacterized membrane protein YjjP (DUF1212 family)